jgi:hypothetical protein
VPRGIVPALNVREAARRLAQDPLGGVANHSRIAQILRRPFGAFMVVFGLHAALVLAWILLDLVQVRFTLRHLMEQIVDRPAYELWWWLQNEFTHLLGTLTYRLSELVGLQASIWLSYGLWFVVVGGLPYALLAALFAFVARSRVAQHARHAA